MTLRDQILEEKDAAMKARDEKKTGILRVLWAAVRNEEIELKRSLDDALLRKVIQRQVKQLQDARIDFERGGRSDLVEKTQYEVALLQAYLPAPLRDEEIETIVKNVLDGQAEKPAFGVAMGMAMKEVAGRADGEKVKEIVTRILGTEKFL